jgi:hypothetical protein
MRVVITRLASLSATSRSSVRSASSRHISASFKYSFGDECLCTVFIKRLDCQRQRATPEVVAGPRYFLFHAYVRTIAGQGSSPQASVAERGACSRLQKRESTMRSFNSIATPNIAKRRKFAAGLRLAALSFAIFTLGASGALAQGAPALGQAPLGHRQPTSIDFPPDVRKDEQLSRAPSQPASATPRSSSAPSQRRTGRTSGGGPPTLQVGPSCEAAGRGGIVLGRNKEACLADETDAQNTLKQNWSKYPATDKTICSGMTTSGGP